MSLYWCTLLLVLIAAISAEDCQLHSGKTCRCSNVTIETIVKWDINCTGLGLGPILQRLDLQFEGQPIKVRSLDFTDCGIETTVVGVFNESTDVEELHLAGNRLSVLPESLVIMNDIKILNLDNNFIAYVPAGILNEKHKLEVLKFRDNGVRDIAENAFPEGLVELDLSHNLLEVVPQKVLSTLSSLKVLSLAFNKILEISQWDFTGLASLEALSISDNQIYHISQNLSVPSLTSLNLDNNKVKYLDPCLQAGLPKLGVDGLQAFNNPWLCSCDMLWINGTATLDAENYVCNSRLYNDYELNAFFYEDCYGVTVECILSEDHFVDCDTCDCDVSGVMECDVDLGPVLKMIDPGDFEITTLTFSAESLYEIDDMAFDKIKDTLESFTLTYSSLEYLPRAINTLTKLTYLELSDNRISVLQSYAFESLKLDDLVLSNNEIGYISETAFVGTGESLQMLWLNGNLMTRIPVESFKWLINLRDLNLAVNSIGSIPSKAFSSSKGLESVDISENQITFVASNAFHGIGTLRTILLYQNKISTLDQCTFSNMTSLETLEAGDNPYYCTCDIAWLTNYDEDNFITYVCEGPDELKDEVILDYVNTNCSTAVNETCDSVDESPVNCNNCRCTQIQNTWLIDCSDSDIGPVVASIERELIVSQLVLSNNNIAVLTSRSLVGTEVYVEQLHLDNNQLKAVPTLIQKLTSLTILNMAHNSIDVIEDDFFVGLSSLEEIDLSHNLISFLDLAFEGLSESLKVLDLHKNNLLEIPSFSLAGLFSLEFLQIKRNSIQTLSKDAFKGLVSLKSLDVSGNEISYISKSAFTGITGSLSRIDITDNALLDIDFCAFNNFINLTDVTANGNPLYCTCNLKWLESTLMDKNMTTCFYPEDVNNQPLVDFLDQRCPDVEEDKENSEEVKPKNDDRCNGTATGIVDCEVCNCTAETSFNQVMTCSDRYQTPFLSAVLTGDFAINVLDLSINSISILGENSFAEISESVHTIDMSHNELRKIPKALEKVENLQELDLSKNFLTSLPRGCFEHYQKLRILKLSKNDIDYIDPEIVSFPNDIEILDLGRNKLSSLTFLTNLLTMTSLNLEYNVIKYITEDSFRDLTEITYIDLTGNKLMYIHPKAFTGLANSLETVLLQNNDFDTISPCPFEGMTSLTTLNMTQNPLRCHCDLNWLRRFIDTPNPNDACLSQDTNKPMRLAEYFDSDCKDDSPFECKNTTSGSASCDVCSCDTDNPAWISMTCSMNTIGSTLYNIDLANLTSIYISGTRLEEIKSNVFVLSAETMLNLEFNDNRIKKIPPFYLPALYEFRMSQNMIITIKNYTFRYLHKVETIDVSNNDIAEIEPMAFNSTNSLEELLLNDNNLTILPTQAFRVLASTHTLRLSNNKIRMIPENAFSEMKSLRSLFLEGNEISYIHRQAFNVVNGSLNYILLMENRLITAPPCTYDNLVNANAQIALYSNTFHCSCNLNWMSNIIINAYDSKYTCSTPLSVHGMKISEFIKRCKASDGICDPNKRDPSVLDCDECSCTDNEMICSGKREVVQTITRKHVTRLILSNNDISVFSQNALDSIRESVTTVTLDENNLESIPIPFSSMPNLVNASFKGNNITVISPNVFIGSQNLKNIDLQNNSLTFIHSDAFNGIEDRLLTLNIANNSLENISMAFNKLTGLQMLNLSNNKISEIGDDTFKGMTSLSTLGLDGNMIASLSDGAFGGLLSLQEIRLERNMIKTILQDTFEKLNLKSVFLFENPLDCSCSIRWLEEYDKVNIDKYTCESSTNDTIPLTKQFDKCDKDEACKRDSTLVANCTTCLCDKNVNGMDCYSIKLGPSLCTVEAPAYDITSLNMTEAGILRITDGTFTNIKETLIFLDLSKNNLTSVPDEIRTLVNLQKFNLSYNKIETVNAMAFVNLTQLEIVDLRHNMIHEVYAEAFVGTYTIIEVDLKFNKLTSIPTEAFSDLVRVKRLILANNAIKLLPKNGFKAMVALESLFLENNNISYIHRNAFDAVNSSLTYLRLEGNNLVTADSCAFNKLVESKTSIAIHQNKLHCSCSLNWMKSINLEVNDNEYTCTTPPDVQGMKLSQFLKRCNSTDGVCNLAERDHSVLDCEECACEKDEMICSGKREVIQITTRTGTTKLTLTNNGIAVFSQNALDSIRGSLMSITLDKNNLTSIPSSLSNMPFLVNASFIGNNIGQIPENAFNDSKKLKNLYLQNNSIEFIHDNAFNGITKELVSLNIEANLLIKIPLAVKKLSNLQSLDISYNKINQIDDGTFNGMESLRMLELDGNLITSISISAFEGLTNIQIIYLQNNKMSTIQSDIFSILKLQSLFLFGNPFQCSCSLLWLDTYITTNKEKYTCQPANVDSLLPITDQFRHCRKLEECRNDNKTVADCGLCKCDEDTNRMDCSSEDLGTSVCSIDPPAYEINYLDLSNNGLSDIADDALLNVKGTLLEIKLSNNHFTVIDDEIKKLNNIKRILLNNNTIVGINENVLSNFTKLEYVDLSGNSMTEIHPNAFTGTKNLTEINLIGNMLPDIPIDAFSKLTFLEVLRLSKNRITMVPDRAFQDMTALTELFLDDNDIEYIHKDAFIGVKDSLRYLKLDGNKLLTTGPCVLDRFTEIDLSILKNPIYCTCGLKWMTRADINIDDDKYVCTGPRAYENSTIRGFLDTCSDNAGTCDPNKPDGGVIDCSACSCTGEEMKCDSLDNIVQIATNVDTTISKLVLTGNNIETLSSMVFQQFKDDLEQLFLDRNMLTEVPRAVQNLSELNTLALGHNMLSTLNENNFKGLNKLESLHIQNNSISTIEEGAFDNLEQLSTIDLEGNSLESVPQKALKSLSSMTSLNLSKNKISSITSSSFESFANLKELKLRGNIVSNLTAGAFKGLNKVTLIDLKENNIATVDSCVVKNLTSLSQLLLGGNPIHCSCSWTWFLETFELDASYVCETPSAFAENTLADYLEQYCTSRRTVCGDYGDTKADCSSCSCDSDSKSFTCAGVKLGPYLSQISDAVKINDIAIAESNIVGVDEDAFILHRSTLKTLKLTSGQLTSIPVVIKQLVVLEDLDFTSNNIASIGQYAFSGMMSLKRIVLTNNKISSLSKYAFSVSSTKKRQAPTLIVEDLKLNGNNLTEIPTEAFIELENIKTLDLSNNQITEVPADVFKGMVNLEEIDLSGNKIESISKDAFRGLVKLITLKLGNNRLTTLDACSFNISTLTSLELSENQFDCSGCSLASMDEWFSNCSTCACASPASKQGISISIYISDDCANATTSKECDEDPIVTTEKPDSEKPLEITLSLSDDGIKVSWVTVGLSNIDGFKVTSEMPSEDKTMSPLLHKDTKEYTLLNPVPGINYNVCVIAVTSSSNATSTVCDNITTRDATPTGLGLSEPLTIGLIIAAVILVIILIVTIVVCCRRAKQVEKLKKEVNLKANDKEFSNPTYSASEGPGFTLPRYMTQTYYEDLGVTSKNNA